jgi:ATP/maltotriose-dependent transcriptional regulator MalT
MQSVVHARQAGDVWLAEVVGMTLASIWLLGQTPVPEAIARCEALIESGLKDRSNECSIAGNLAVLKAMNGELGSARELLQRSRSALRDLGQGALAASTAIDVMLVEMHGGDLAAAEKEVLGDYEFLSAAGETYALSSLAALLSQVVRDQGRDDEALEYLSVAEATSASDDLESQVAWRSIRAPIAVRAGDFAAAEKLAQGAVELARRTESPMLKANALAEQAEVLKLADRIGEAREAISEAITLATAKGNVVARAQYEAWAVSLGRV